MAATEIILDQSWAWKQRNASFIQVTDELSASETSAEDTDLTSRWRAAKTFPSEIHVELLKAGLIPDPYLGFNEHQVQWIGEVEWLYKTTFPFHDLATQNAVLEFYGLDTVCDVYLNGVKVLSTDNMFQAHYVNIDTSSLKASNSLLLHFKSAAQLARTLESQMGRVRAGSTNLGDPSRVYVRKAQYDWRWDWGPELMTCGIYRPVILRTYNTCLGDIHTHAIVSDDLSCSLKVDVELQGALHLAHTLRVTLEDLTGLELRTENIELTGNGKVNSVDWKLENNSVQLWWPVGYGKQNLYRVKVLLLGEQGFTVDSKSMRIGFRGVRLVQDVLAEPDQYGTGSTFLFEVNGVRIFMGGSNWIPADNFLTTLTPDRYRAWLTLLRDGNQNMVRLWGGGVYEPDVFYDVCDEIGLLVWQDFQFACGVYPAHDEFVSSVRKEAEQNVKRLRHHPAMALFCGNNEDYQMVLQWGDVKDFPAIKIYEEVLPSVVEALTDPAIPYHRGSPYGGQGWDTADPTVGDVHQWNIWGGKELPYQDYDKLGGRFVSEFGMPSMPCMRTIAYWMQGADERAWHAQSKLMAQHCRAGSFERRFAIAMNDNFRITEDLETAVFNTQMMQSEAVGFAYQSWRRQWRGKGKEYTSGVLVWQANDCWPVTSWAIADYFLRPKPVYFTIARHLAPYAVGIFRTVIKNKQNDRPRQFYEFGSFQSRGATLDIWAVNGTLSLRSVTLELHFVDLNSEWNHKETHTVELLPNQASELLCIPCPGPPKIGPSLPTGYADWTTSCSVVASARLLDLQTGEVLSRFADWPQPYRFIEVPDPGLKVSLHNDTLQDIASVTLEVEKPAKCVVFSVNEPGQEVKWSDNALDLMPGDRQTVTVRGLGSKNLEVAYFGKEKAHKL